MKPIAAYCIVGLLTFGYSYNADYTAPRSEFVRADELNSLSALMAGMFWPLYWSTQAFRGLRPA
jgi:hypothetical protein